MADKRLVVRGNAALCERELKVEHKKMSNKKKKTVRFRTVYPVWRQQHKQKKKTFVSVLAFLLRKLKKKIHTRKRKTKEKETMKNKTQRGWRYWNTHYPVKQRFWSENNKGSSHHYTITLKKRHGLKKKKNLSLKCVKKKKKKRKCYERVSKTHLGRSKKKKQVWAFLFFFLRALKRNNPKKRAVFPSQTHEA